MNTFFQQVPAQKIATLGPLVDIQELRAPGLHIQSFVFQPGESWCILGANDSGLERFCDLFSNRIPASEIKAQRCLLPPHPGVLSFQSQQDIFEDELRKDDTDFIGRLDPGTAARAFLRNPEQYHDLVSLFSLQRVLDQGYRQLSSGQARKLCLLAQISHGCRFLVLETPYEGLDAQSCTDLDHILDQLQKQGLALLVLVHNHGDIPSWCSHLAIMHKGEITRQGATDSIRPAAAALFQAQSSLFQVTIEEFRAERREETEGRQGASLIRLRQGFARYGEREVFSNLDLDINEGDHTLISGPNGCGKSTLLHLITGDHPLCYANDLHIFGTRRGSGESIWDIRKHMGIVSPDLHRSYRASGSVLAVVLSGLFDSIGLYDKTGAGQRQQAMRWLERLHLEDKAKLPFRRLSYGEQRLILLARALIKVPRLLILDEPSQGLDASRRNALLHFLAEVAKANICTILYVSHREDEHRDFFCQRISFS